MVECLAENRQIDRVVRYWRFFQVSNTILQIRVSVLLGELGPDFDHSLGDIDGNDLSSALGQNLGERAFTRAQVSNVDRRDHGQEKMRQSLPGSTRTIASSKFAGQLIKILAGAVLPLGDHMMKARTIRRRLRHICNRQPDQTSELRFLNRTGWRPTIIDVFPDAPISDQTGYASTGRDESRCEIVPSRGFPGSRRPTILRFGGCALTERGWDPIKFEVNSTLTAWKNGRYISIS